jgi:hypothetical protein
MKREEISLFEYHDHPLDRGRSIRFFLELFSDGRGRFIVEDEFSGQNMVCSTLMTLVGRFSPIGFTSVATAHVGKTKR